MEQKYEVEFPDHSRVQRKFVENRQKLEGQSSPMVSNDAYNHTALISDLSTGKQTHLGSETTRPGTYHLNSDSSKNCTLSNGKPIFDVFKGSSVKKDEELGKAKYYENDKENERVRTNIAQTLDAVAEKNRNKSREP